MMKTNLKEETKDKDCSVDEALNYAIEKGYGMAMWRMPNSQNFYLLIGKTLELTGNLELESLKTGFIFHPFDTNSHKIIYIEASAVWKITGQACKNIHGDVNFSDLKRSTEFYLNDYKVLLTEKSTFFDSIVHAKANIKSENFEKVVLSQNKVRPLPQGFKLLSFFEKLQKKYPNAFVNLVSTPKTGTWTGATPELLLSSSGNLFKTVSLAGTQVVPDSFDIEEAAWKQKEIEEQALVSRYIINCFKKIRLREFHEKGPYTIKAGNLIHLKTDFLVDMKATGFPELPSVMLKLLHPTSAICGMPKKEALEFIYKHEKYDRKYYSGYLGPVNFRDNTHIYVNLRCLELQSENAIAYAGAGITHSSDPEKEWIETEMKTRIMLDVLAEKYL